MEPLDDYPIGSETLGVPVAGRDRSSHAGRVAAVAMILAAALAAFVVTRRGAAPPPQETAVAGTSGTQAERRPLGAPAEARELPPLASIDPLVRELVGALSSRPELAAWLATEGLIRNLVATVDAVANGATPSPQLRRLAPELPFSVETRGSGLVIASSSYARYDGIADAVAGIDAQGVARAYTTLRPRLQEAYHELGYPDGNFDSAVERAVGRLLDTPRLERPADVQRAPVIFHFVDARLESLSAAQKQLLRMGPRNQRLIQDKLRAIAAALGITAPTST